jgi:hypothetical protein
MTEGNEGKEVESLEDALDKVQEQKGDDNVITDDGDGNLNIQDLEQGDDGKDDGGDPVFKMPGGEGESANEILDDFDEEAPDILNELGEAREDTLNAPEAGFDDFDEGPGPNEDEELENEEQEALLGDSNENANADEEEENELEAEDQYEQQAE